MNAAGNPGAWNHLMPAAFVFFQGRRPLNDPVLAVVTIIIYALVLWVVD